MENLVILTIMHIMFHILSAMKIMQVPKAKDLKNHFGSELKKNFYGPHHNFNKNSFLNNDESIFSKFNSDNNLIIASGKINYISKEAENIVSPYLPVK